MLLRQNAELRRIGVWNWSLPASMTVLDDGRRVNVCPAADACVRLCYARVNTYAFRPVQAAHRRNLERVLDDLSGWHAEMLTELSAKRFRPSGKTRRFRFGLDDWAAAWAGAGGVAVRIHDSGDFFSDNYTRAWLDIARANPDVLFYAHTKEVPRFRQLVEPVAPVNFRWLYSLGGRFDGLIDRERDRHCDVFPTLEALLGAGYWDQSTSDLVAVLAPTTRIGIVANNIPQLKRRQGNESFAGLQARRQR